MTSSPCTKVCKIKEGICTGCHRTLEQIGAWGSMTDKERQEAMAKMGYTHPASAEVERLQAQVVELVAVAVSVRDDLLLRSEIDSDGTRCVNLSASKWSSFCDVIDDNESMEDDQ